MYSWRNTGRRVRVFHEEKPENIKWKEVPADYVIESTGKFTEIEPATVIILILFGLGVSRANAYNLFVKLPYFFC